MVLIFKDEKTDMNLIPKQVLEAFISIGYNGPFVSCNMNFSTSGWIRAYIPSYMYERLNTYKTEGFKLPIIASWDYISVNMQALIQTNEGYKMCPVMIVVEAEN